FDYLSTVSGGGYVGSMLAAWMYRTPGGAGDVEAALAGRAETDALDTLRRYVRYLAPKQGFSSIDTWTLVSTYVRNFTLNALIWLPVLALVLTIPLVAATFVDWINAAVSDKNFLRAASIVCSGASLLAILYGVFCLRNAISGKPALAASDD